MLFSGTVASNIKWFATLASDKLVESAAAKIAQAEEFISELKMVIKVVLAAQPGNMPALVDGVKRQ